uniref:Uncharacterized protein n=1 Tax=Candidatus Berkiella cookevillensis TaxID=437022 RepID=A0A0Q9YCP3_9GAMM
MMPIFHNLSNQLNKVNVFTVFLKSKFSTKVDYEQTIRKVNIIAPTNFGKKIHTFSLNNRIYCVMPAKAHRRQLKEFLGFDIEYWYPFFPTSYVPRLVRGIQSFEPLNVNQLVYYEMHELYVEAARREKRFKNWYRQ